MIQHAVAQIVRSVQEAIKQNRLMSQFNLVGAIITASLSLQSEWVELVVVDVRVVAPDVGDLWPSERRSAQFTLYCQAGGFVDVRYQLKNVETHCTIVTLADDDGPTNSKQLICIFQGHPILYILKLPAVH